MTSRPGSPVLSVVVPCFDVAPYVLQTLQSLRANADPAFEFLLVDDASTDATPGLLAEWAPSVPGARVITRSTNGGLAVARNTGLAEARGEFLTFLDGDDFVARGHFARLVAAIRRLGCDMVRTDHVQVHGRRRTVHRVNHGPRGVVGPPRDAILPVDRASSVDAPYAWAGIYSRRLLERGLLAFPADLRTCEDRPWAWRLHLHAESFAVVGLLGLFYRRGVATSLTQVADERQLDFVPAYDQIVAEVAVDRDAERLLPKAVRSYCAIICHHLRRSERYAPALAERLRWRSARALDRLPADVLGPVLRGLDPPRRDVLTALRAS